MKLVEITVMILVQVKVEAVNLGVGVDQQVEAEIKDCLKDIHHHHLQEVIQDIINILEVEAVAEVEVEVIQEHEIDDIEIGPDQEVTIDIKTQDVKIHLHLLHRQNQQVPDILLKEEDHHHHHLLQHQQLLHLLHLAHLVLLNQVILNIEIKKCTEKLEIDRVVEQKITKQNESSITMQ